MTTKPPRALRASALALAAALALVAPRSGAQSAPSAAPNASAAAGAGAGAGAAPSANAAPSAGASGAPGSAAAPASPPAHGAEDEASADAMGSLPGFRRATLAPQFAQETEALPRGVVQVRVVTPDGRPLEGVTVRLGMLREGERTGGHEARTGGDGVAEFTGLPTGMGIAYRPYVEADGAKFSATPFVLGNRFGHQVQLIRFPVEREPRSVLLSDLRTELNFDEDRIVVVVRVSLVNFSTMALDGGEPRPYAFVPTQGLRFRLPPGYSAFRSEERTMGDQRVVEEAGHAVLRGSFPPSERGEPYEVAFQFRMKLEGRTELTLPIDLPWLPVLRAIVATQAPAGMRLEVAGMPPAQERSHNGQRILITGAQRESRDEPELRRLQVRLVGIPATSGPARNGAAVLASALIALGVLGAWRRNRRGAVSGAAAKAAQSARTGELDERRATLLDELRALREAHAAGEVGPETYARQRRALVEALALVLRAQEAAA